METLKVGILGATGAVGQRFIEALADHPWFELSSLAASERSAGKQYARAADWRLASGLPGEIGSRVVVSMKPEEVDADIVFSALPADVARTVEPAFARAGFMVASNASAFRQSPDVPLIIPEVNPDHLGLIDVQRDSRKWDGAIVTNPNCSVIMLAVTLKPMVQFGIEDVKVATMQAVSGAGYDGVSSMAILDNVIPYIGGEEDKVENEAQKLLGTFDGNAVVNAVFDVSASCHRVPVLDGHTEAVWISLADDPTPEEVRGAFLNFDPGLDLPTEPKPVIIVHDEPDRPQPRLDRNAGDGMSVSVGRIREGIRYIAMGHNTVRGAAGASVLNAEFMLSRGLL
ncbi:MAG TPA: aspartate-semialdehyde dehydrogenase [Methanosarcinales archaeon]|nr:aspartate-semialdehyde dehydrogenase [Methanosarcinales archaeon]